MKKTALILCALIMVSALSSCGGDSKVEKETDKLETTILNTSDTSDNEGGQTEKTFTISDRFGEDTDFGGKTIRFLTENAWEGSDPITRSITVAEDTGDVVDSAVYKRNILISDKLGLNVEIAKTVEPMKLTQEVASSVMAGTDDYDVIGGYQAYSIGIAATGNLFDLAKIPNLTPDAPYWAAQYIKDMSYKSTYWVTGNMTTRYTGGMYAAFVNASTWDKYFADKNIYDVVKDGKWTLDYMTSAVSEVYSDLNGDGEVNNGDSLGFTFNTLSNIDILSSGAAVRYSERDANGVPKLAIQSERTAQFYEKLYKLLYETNGSLLRDDKTETFASGNIFCIVDMINSSIINFRDMKDDFYIIPTPKLNEEQEKYNTQIHDDVTLFGIPITNKNLEATGALLEAMAIESENLLLPAYYDTALKVKYSRDTASGEMLDLIRDSVTTDFVYMYTEKLGEGAKPGGIMRVFRAAAKDRSENIMSMFEANNTIYETNLKNMLEIFEEQAKS